MKRLLGASVLLLLAGCRSMEADRALGPIVKSPTLETPAILRVSDHLSQPTEVPTKPEMAILAVSWTQEKKATLLPPIDLELMKSAVPAALAEQTVDLQGVLVLAGVDNPTIALALEAVRASQAQQLQAQSLLLPTLSGGANFDWHEGNLQSAQGVIRDVDRQAAYVGGGAGAVGASTVGVPAVRITAQLGDALFEPEAARYLVEGRQLDAQATRNAILLEVSTRYFALVGAEARLRAMRDSEAEFAEIARLTDNFAKTGRGREADAERAQTEALLLHSAAQRIDEDIVVTGAELARLLNVDPSIRLRVLSTSIPLMQLVDPRDNLENLVQIAFANRPEIAARSADVAVVQTRLKKENLRPFLPVVSVGFSAGGFGGGGNQADTGFGHFSGRTDFDATAFWTLQNFGFGNLAIQRQLRAQVGESNAERVRVIDAVRQEVADAFALSAARRQAVDISSRRLETSRRAFQQDLTRAKNLEGRPIEVLDSAKLLSAARQEYVRAVIGYNQAQLQLFVSLGQPPIHASEE